MRKQTEHFDRVWRWTKLSFCLVVLGVVALAVWSVVDPSAFGDASQGDVLVTLTQLLVFGLVVLGFCGLIYKLLRKRAEHYERRK